MSLAEKVISNNIDAARTSRMVIDEDPGLDGERGKVDRPNSWVKLYAPEEPVPVIRVERGLVSHVEGESLEGEDCDMAKHGTAGAFESIDMWGMERSIFPEDDAAQTPLGMEQGCQDCHKMGCVTTSWTRGGPNWISARALDTDRCLATRARLLNSPNIHLETSSLVRDWVSYGTSPLRSSFRDMRPTRNLLSAPGEKIIDDLVETRRDTTRWKTTGRTDAADRLPQVACGTTEAILATWPAISSQNATSSQATRIKT
eukprot:GFUD01021622.1.p1 GENE.GFUD01021622.1~~GFUD01021622.1.p1  ORF type:complete len:258 (+),score=15.57 GFUD01021622.1:110-883(+)